MFVETQGPTFVRSHAREDSHSAWLIATPRMSDFLLRHGTAPLKSTLSPTTVDCKLLQAFMC